jgi:hypothetical protein
LIRHTRYVAVFAFFALLLATSFPSALAQNAAGRITGTVTDPSGAVVAEAKITVTNVATQVKYEATSTTDGYFQVPLLPIGTYDVTIEKSGFVKASFRNQALQINQVLRLDVKLEVGGQVEAVEVKDQADVIETVNPTIGASVTGRTLTDMPASPGGDNHDMWIDPTNGDRMSVANDSGVSISVNRGRTWDRIQVPIAQIYHVPVDNQIPYFVYGNKQDGPSYRGPSNSLQFGGGGGPGTISRSVWHSAGGGESGFATPDPVDNNIIWSSGTGSGSIGGVVARFDERNHQARDVEVWPETTVGAPAADVRYRFNWEFPIVFSRHDQN